MCFVASASAKALVVSDETERTMRATWNAPPGPVQHYKLTYVPQAGGKEMTIKVPGGVTTAVLKKLQPFTTYNINVHPIYKRGEGKARQGVGTTRTLANNSKPMSQRSVQTRQASLLLLLAFNKPQKPKNLDCAVIVFVSVDRILIFLFFSAVSPYKAPRNLQTSEPTKTSFRVSWDPAPGNVRGYKVTFHPIGSDIDLGELQVGPYDNTVVLEELR